MAYLYQYTPRTNPDPEPEPETRLGSGRSSGWTARQERWDLARILRLWLTANAEALILGYAEPDPYPDPEPEPKRRPRLSPDSD